MSSAAPGANICCYTSHPQNDASYQAIGVACTHENLHQRSSCVSVVNLTTNTLRANTVTATELQATQLISEDPITAGSFSAGASVLVTNGPGIFAFSSIVFTPEVSNNVGVNGPGNGIIVGEDGWYQISFEMTEAAESLALTPTTSVGVGINGSTSSFTGLDSLVTGAMGAPNTISGNTLSFLFAGDLISMFVSVNDGGAGLNTINVGSARLAASRLGP